MDNKNKVQKSSKKKVNEEIHGLVTDCDRSIEVVANCDHLRSLKFRPTLPFAFTEQGIGQLSSVVHSKKAIERSIAIMNAFVAMRRFMVQNAGILMRIAHLERHQIETDEKIDMILDKMEEKSPKLLPEQIFQTGCVWDAWAYVSDLVRSAKKRIGPLPHHRRQSAFPGCQRERHWRRPLRNYRNANNPR
jgi:hypothetical protein